MTKNLETKNIYKKFGQIASFLAYPIVVIAVFIVLVIYFSTPSGALPQIFGYSIVRIQTPSMTSAGFLVGDVVFITREVPDKLNQSDIVAFYKYFDYADQNVYSTLIPYEDWDGVVTGEDYVTGTRVNKTTLQDRGEVVYFHYIREVLVAPSDGTIYYVTGGSNPNTAADGYIRADYVVGTYAETPVVLKYIMSFSTSTLGLIVLVVFPLSALVLLEAFSLIDQVNKYILENKIYDRKIRFDSFEVLKYDIGKDMENPRKIIFFLTSKKEEREKVFSFLYAGFNKENSTAKDKDFYKTALQAKHILETENPRKYFDFWLENLKSKAEIKELQKLQKEFEYKQIIKNIK